MSVSVSGPAFQAKDSSSLPVNDMARGSTAAQKQDANDPTLHINPVLQFDMKAKVLLFQIVDPVSGEIEQQYPSEKKLEAYQKAMEEQQDALPEVKRADSGIEAPGTPASMEDDTNALPDAPARDQDTGARPSTEVSLVA